MTTTDEAKSAYHHGNLRAALLAAVREVIRDKGIGSVSLREAARRAGVSHSAPAHHFGDKLGMLTAFAIEGFAEFRGRMEAAYEATTDPHDALNAIGLVYLEFAVSEPEWFDVMFRSELHDRDHPELSEAAQAAFAVLMKAVEAACGDDIAENEVMAVALGAWSKVHGIATLWRDGALQMFADQPFEELATQIMTAPPPPEPDDGG